MSIAWGETKRPAEIESSTQDQIQENRLNDWDSNVNAVARIIEAIRTNGVQGLKDELEYEANKGPEEDDELSLEEEEVQDNVREGMALALEGFEGRDSTNNRKSYQQSYGNNELFYAKYLNGIHTKWGPLEWAIHLKQEDTVRLLLEKGFGRKYQRTSQNSKSTQKNKKSIFSSVRPSFLTKQTKILPVNKKEFASVNGEDNPIHWAAFSGNLKIINILLDYGFDPNARDNTGNTPLHLAATASSLLKGDHLYIIELLISENVPLKVRNWFGNTPLQLAVHPVAQQLLRKAIKKELKPAKLFSRKDLSAVRKSMLDIVTFFETSGKFDETSSTFNWEHVTLQDASNIKKGLGDTTQHELLVERLRTALESKYCVYVNKTVLKNAQRWYRALQVRNELHQEIFRLAPLRPFQSGQPLRKFYTHLELFKSGPDKDVSTHVLSQRFKRECELEMKIQHLLAPVKAVKTISRFNLNVASVLQNHLDSLESNKLKIDAKLKQEAEEALENANAVLLVLETAKEQNDIEFRVVQDKLDAEKRAIEEALAAEAKKSKKGKGKGKGKGKKSKKNKEVKQKVTKKSRSVSPMKKQKGKGGKSSHVPQTCLSQEDISYIESLSEALLRQRHMELKSICVNLEAALKRMFVDLEHSAIFSGGERVPVHEASEEKQQEITIELSELKKQREKQFSPSFEALSKKLQEEYVSSSVTKQMCLVRFQRQKDELDCVARTIERLEIQQLRSKNKAKSGAGNRGRMAPTTKGTTKKAKGGKKSKKTTGKKKSSKKKKAK